jgi:protein-L-isoaspartate O-methyltransferase
LATDVTAPAPTAADLRQRLVEELRVSGAITTDAVAHAMLTVPREAFAPLA